MTERSGIIQPVLLQKNYVLVEKFRSQKNLTTQMFSWCYCTFSELAFLILTTELLFHLFYRWGRWGLGRFSNLLKYTHLVRDRVRTWTQISLMPNTASIMSLLITGGKTPTAYTMRAVWLRFIPPCHSSVLSPAPWPARPPAFKSLTLLGNTPWALHTFLPSGAVHCTSVYVFTQSYEGTL